MSSSDEADRNVDAKDKATVTNNRGNKKVNRNGKNKRKTKRVNAALNWTFTWFDYPENWKDIFHELEGKLLDCYCIGVETTKKGRPHLQGWLRMIKKGRPIERLRLDKQIHWEIMREDADTNVRYCTKQSGEHVLYNVDTPYTIDIELRPWQAKLVDILKTKPNDRDIHWIWEPVGGIGKTTFQKWATLNIPKGIVLSGKSSDMKYGVLDYKNAHGELPKYVMMNIPRSYNHQHLNWTGIEEIKDMLFFSTKYEPGMVCGPNPHLLIFSNEPPITTRLSLDRWKIWRIVDQDLVPEVL